MQQAVLHARQALQAAAYIKEAPSYIYNGAHLCQYRKKIHILLLYTLLHVCPSLPY